MKYVSTRDANKKTLNSSQIILKGLSEDGGLFVPENIPLLSLENISSMKNTTYQEKAKKIFSFFLTDFTNQEIDHCIKLAYNKNIFDSLVITPLSHLTKNKYVLELFHGPTYSFKDIALQILPHFLVISAKKNKDTKTYVILVATSGDTGKAALEGFKNIKKVKILVFYPNKGISTIQRLQMVTQKGNNLNVFAVDSNFDDVQNTIKKIFSNTKLNKELIKNNYIFNSANSINFGRLLPQIVYYFQSYFYLIEKNKIKLGDYINFSVPTGNFGNILAGYLAKKMGLPIKKLICSSNSNNILTEFISTGIYNKNRPFYKTVSPSMDILISSNLERLLYFIHRKNTKIINNLMKNLNKKGVYKIHKKFLDEIKEDIWAGYANEEDTLKTIKDYFNKYNYLMDTHTAVANKVHDDYMKITKDKTFCVIVSTASSYKFNKSISKIFIKNSQKYTEEILFEKIHKLSKKQIPKNLKNLIKKNIRFNQVINKKDILKNIKLFLKI